MLFSSPENKLARRVAEAEVFDLHLDPSSTSPEVLSLRSQLHSRYPQLSRDDLTNYALLGVKVDRLCYATTWLPYDKHIVAYLRKDGFYLPQVWDEESVDAHFLPVLFPKNWRMYPFSKDRTNVPDLNKICISHPKRSVIYFVGLICSYPRDIVFAGTIKRLG